MKKLSYKTSQKILKVLAEISTKEHAEQIIKRNTEALEKGSSDIHCPHCTPNTSCKDCLWAYAIKHVIKKALNINILECPCIYVAFINKDLNNVLDHHIPNTISLDEDFLKIEDPSCEDAIQWLKAHIDWAKNMEWGKRVVNNYRNEFNKI
jgi:hypothetical protein